MGFLDLKRALVVEDSELEANGGRYCITSGPAIKVRSASGQEETQPSIPVPIYVVGDADLRENGGNYLVESGVARPVSPVHESEQVVGRWAQPVYADPDDAGFYPTFEFSEALAAFTPSMAKRNGAAAGPFAAGPLVQGDWDGTGVPDQMTFPRGNLIGNAVGRWYDNYDPYQGSIVLWITPEWDGNDGLIHNIVVPCVAGIQYLTKDATNVLRAYFGGGVLDINVAAWTAGTTYSLVFRWDSKNTLDGTNYLCMSINGAHTFGRTAYVADEVPVANVHIGGSAAGVNSMDSLIEGFTIYRRPLFDGQWGVDVGNGDEIALIAAGADPCLFTGSWDATFCLPTNATVEELVTGPGEAWSMPHASNEVEHGWMEDGGYLGGGYAPIFNAATTSAIVNDHVNIQDLHGGQFTAEAYIRTDGWGENDYGNVFGKSAAANEGWVLLLTPSNGLYAIVYTDATSALSTCGLDEFAADGKWHHVAMIFDGTLLPAGNPVISIWIDGIPVASYVTQTAGTGAIVTDVGNDFYIGNRLGGARTFDGAIGWSRLSNNLRYTAGVGFIAPRQPPAVDGNTVAQWEMTEGTGAVLDNATGLAALDATITNHTWEAQWDMEGTPLIPRSVEYNGTTTSCVVADAVRIQDLHAGAMTAEAWVRADGWGENYGHIFAKNASANDEGWVLVIGSAFGISTEVRAAATSAWSTSGTDEFSPDGKWHLITMQYDNGGDRRIYLWVDGIPISSYPSQNAAVGLIATDVGNDLYIGNQSVNNRTWDGSLGGWCRLSNILRYTNGEAFVPNSRFNPPAPDVNTAWQTDYSDGAGGVLTDDSAGANPGALTNHIWRNVPDMEVDAPGERNYAWGYVLGCDAVDEGMTQIKTGMAAGDDFVCLAMLAPDASSRGQLEVTIWDETAGAAIVDFTGPKYTGTHSGLNNLATLEDNTNKLILPDVIGWEAWNITDGSHGTITAYNWDGTDTFVVAALAGGVDNDWDTGDVYRLMPPRGYDKAPWTEVFTFENPAGCTSWSCKVRNVDNEGSLYCHQVLIE